MQTKSSYRVLKWTLMAGVMASLGACVVTSGDGGDDEFGDGGESGSSTTTAGKTSTAGSGGSTSTAGKPSTGGGGSTSTAGTSAGGDGAGGAAYVPGLCEADDPTPTSIPSCTPDAKDEDPANACRTCLKKNCCDDWQSCFGDTPTTACGSGPTEDSDGQFECVRGCYLDDMSGGEPVDVLGECEGKCLGQCTNVDDGFSLTDTTALLGCGQDNCLAECFTQ